MEPPVIAGHEFSGRVVKLGPGAGEKHGGGARQAAVALLHMATTVLHLNNKLVIWNRTA